jgi:hypothetical protein
MRIQLRKEHDGCYIHIAADFGKTPEFNVLTFILFIDYEKAYNLSWKKLLDFREAEHMNTPNH